MIPSWPFRRSFFILKAKEKLILEHILAVEDDADLRGTILEVLENAGFDVVMAANGQEALQALALDRRTSLILLGLKMPVMDGLEFRCRKLQNPLLASVPVALVSGDSRGQAEANRLGFAGSLKKPFGVPELLALARRTEGGIRRCLHKLPRSQRLKLLRIVSF